MLFPYIILIVYKLLFLKSNKMSEKIAPSIKAKIKITKFTVVAKRAFQSTSVKYPSYFLYRVASNKLNFIDIK